MGINNFCSVNLTGLNYETSKINEWDPNPKNFIIEKYKEINNNLAIMINYPNCINYEGKKIIVYKNLDWNTLKNLKEIDPHFTNDGNIRPFARFEPTEMGWLMATYLLKLI